MSPEDEDTNPEIVDPVLLVVSRMEGKLDTIILYLKDLNHRVTLLESYNGTAAE